MILNRTVRLLFRPVGEPKASDFGFTDEPIPALDDGQIKIKVRYVSLDPAMRGWMREGKSYIEPVVLGEVMRAGGVGEVVQSTHPKFAVGDQVSGMTGVQTFCVSNGRGFVRLDPSKVPLTAYMNVLGAPGMTAYFGLFEVGKPTPGETVVVSGAVGAVGSTVGQIAKILGCRVIGIAGGDEKCRQAVHSLGFDACIDYKSEDLKVALKQHCPNGVDVYFDNVGGAVLDAVLTRLAFKARIVICGAISQYNNEGATIGPANYLSLLVNRARMEGMVVFDYASRYKEATEQLSAWMDAGKLVSREHVVMGIDTFPSSLLMLFKGQNSGKLALEVST